MVDLNQDFVVQVLLPVWSSTWLLMLLFNTLIHAYNKHRIFLASRKEDSGEKDSSLRLKTPQGNSLNV